MKIIWKVAVLMVVLCFLPLPAWGEAGKKNSPGSGKNLAYSGIPGKFTRGAKAKRGKQAAATNQTAAKALKKLKA